MSKTAQQKTGNAGLDKRTKWSYCIGATGRDAAYALVSMYLITYIQYTMNLSAAQFATISAIMAGCLVWDAINDPLMGIIIENAHLKHGKYRPWILLGAVLNAALIVVLFTVRPQGWSFVLFFGISYLLWGMTFTMNDISYWGMLPSLSSDASTRNMLVTLMSIFVCFGQFAVAGIVPTVIAGNAVNAYRVVALVVALAFLGFQLLVYLGVTERERKNTDVKLSLKDMLKIFMRNDQLIPAGIGYFLFNIGSNLLIIFGYNFFNFEFGYSDAGNLIFIFTVMFGLGTLFSQAIFAAVSKKLSRRKILTYSIIMICVGYLLLLGYGYVIPKNIILLNAIGFLIFFCQGIFNMTMIVMINNTIEYDEYKFHERHDSVISTVRSFAVKFASALNQGISALVLIISGIYSISRQISELEINVGKGEMTSEQALATANGYISGVTDTQTFILRLGMVFIPMLVLLGCYLIVRRKYRIDEQMYADMVAEIEARQ
ncbi:MAG: MFS transporter [Lachnospiraceae bacterium]|nr:MFS transporter [Lachnospiraceae bacterium]